MLLTPKRSAFYFQTRKWWITFLGNKKQLQIQALQRISVHSKKKPNNLTFERILSDVCTQWQMNHQHQPLSCPHQGWVNDILRAGTWPFAFALHKPSAVFTAKQKKYQRNPTIFRHSWPEWRYTQIYWYHLISSDTIWYSKMKQTIAMSRNKGHPTAVASSLVPFPEAVTPARASPVIFQDATSNSDTWYTSKEPHPKHVLCQALYQRETCGKTHKKQKTMLSNGSWWERSKAELRRWNEGIDGWP